MTDHRDGILLCAKREKIPREKNRDRDRTSPIVENDRFDVVNQPSIASFVSGINLTLRYELRNTVYTDKLLEPVAR